MKVMGFTAPKRVVESTRTVDVVILQGRICHQPRAAAQMVVHFVEATAVGVVNVLVNIMNACHSSAEVRGCS